MKKSALSIRDNLRGANRVTKASMALVAVTKGVKLSPAGMAVEMIESRAGLPVIERAVRQNFAGDAHERMAHGTSEIRRSALGGRNCVVELKLSDRQPPKDLRHPDLWMGYRLCLKDANASGLILPPSACRLCSPSRLPAGFDLYELGVGGHRRVIHL